MHHLLITIGSHGDTHPFVGIGAKLRQRGHRVTLVANGHFESLTRAAGLDFIELGTSEEFLKALESPDLWHPVKSFRLVFESGVLHLMRPTYDIIQKHYVPGETIVTAHAIAFGARIAQEILGCPLATIHLAPAVFRSIHQPPVFGRAPFIPYLPKPLLRALWWFGDHYVADPVLAPPINALRAELGLPPVSKIIDQWWNSPQRVIALFPDWFAPPQPDWPPQVKLTGFPLYDESGVHTLSPELSTFLNAGPPPVAFTFGSAMMHSAPQFQASAEACRLAGLRGLLLTRHRAQIPAHLPDGVQHFDYAPFSELLPRCAALVHHGGIGTTAQALASGVPQLVMPLAHDQHDNAARVRRLGVGTEIATKKYRAKNVANALKRLLADPEMPARCRRVADRFKNSDPLAQTCDLIEQLVNSPAAGERQAHGKYPATIQS
jgi:UDP:flavonoid glycosyltransferase YjiC (YdhE family)